MTGFARRCWTCHATYTLEEFRQLEPPIIGGEHQKITGSTTLILRQCKTPGCDNTLALPESQVYPPDTSADVVNLAAVRDAKTAADKPLLHVGTGDGENIGRVWLAGASDPEGWDVINDRLGLWLSPNNAEALAEMLKGAAAKARGMSHIQQYDPRDIPPSTRLTVRSQQFHFREPIPLPPAEHTVRFNFQTGECEVVEPETQEPKEEP